MAYYLQNIQSCLFFFFDKRMVAKDEEGLIIGYLPTKYNYLRACIADNYTYEGIVNAVLTSPIKTVSIAITPLKK